MEVCKTEEYNIRCHFWWIFKLTFRNIHSMKGIKIPKSTHNNFKDDHSKINKKINVSIYSNNKLKGFWNSEKKQKINSKYILKEGENKSELKYIK